MIALLRLAGLPRLIGQAGEAPLPAEPDFWRLWLVGLILHCVRWIESIAMAIFVYQDTGSAFLVAFVTMLRMLPMGLFGTFLGAITDRLDRRTCLVLVVASVLATSCLLTGLAHMGRLEVWHLGLASFLNGIGWAADNPVRRVMMAEVVGPRRLATAMSIDVGTNQASRVIGPAIGGVLLATFGLMGCFALDAALCLVAIGAVIVIGYRNNPLHRASVGLLSHIADGLKLARNDARLRGILIVTIIFNLFAWPCTSMIPVIGQDNLQLSASGIGILASMEGIGAVFGSIVIGIWARPSHYAALYVGGLMVCEFLLIVFALAPGAPLAGAALVVLGLGGAGFTIMQSTLIYRSISPDMRGRILGLLSACIGVSPLGFVQIGLVADAIGAKGAVVATASAGLLAMLLLRRHWSALSERARDV